jgi:Na+(H+)/acetate symporter ActP
VSGREELREPPSDPIWMETEEIGLSDAWMRVFIAAFVLALALIIALGLALS